MSNERFITVLVTHEPSMARFVANAFDEAQVAVELHVLSALAPLDRYAQHAPVRVAILHAVAQHSSPLAMLSAYRQTMRRMATAPLPVVLLSDAWNAIERVKALRSGADDTIDTSSLGKRALPYIVTRAAGETGFYGKRLQELVRLQSLGELAGGVAHDFNNFLSAILGRVGVLKHAVKEERMQRSLSVIERAALDAAETVNRIRRFSRGEADAPYARVVLLRLVEEAVDMLEPRLAASARRGVRHEIAVSARAEAEIMANPTEIKEVLLNLLQNALDAMPLGGAIAVELDTSATFIELRVSDQGTGMDERVRAQATEAYFSTKGERGTGLGLSVAQEIMARHGGSLDIASEVGAGTVVSLRFPMRQTVDQRPSGR